MPVSQVDRQLRQKFLNIPAFAIPDGQSMNCRCVAQVVKAWLASRTTFAMQTSMQPNLLESSFEHVDRDRFPVSSNKERSMSLLGRSITPPSVFGKHSNCLGSDRHQP
jgi:hypothetical protein